VLVVTLSFSFSLLFLLVTALALTLGVSRSLLLSFLALCFSMQCFLLGGIVFLELKIHLELFNSHVFRMRSTRSFKELQPPLLWLAIEKAKLELIFIELFDWFCWIRPEEVAHVIVQIDDLPKGIFIDMQVMVFKIEPFACMKAKCLA